MSRITTRIAVTAASVAVLAGVSVAATGSVAAAETGRQGVSENAVVGIPRGETTASTMESPTGWRVYSTLRSCMTAGNTLAQQGKLTGYRCEPRAAGGFYLIHW
ncbi:hypothetical protein [Streptomyces sp. B6B3]|uniref:hypothetical protein n=1 Tax=Streptomyces sp. B6B3 TaxID=3153570 RepID=UPI00325CDEF1